MSLFLKNIYLLTLKNMKIDKKKLVNTNKQQVIH